MKQKMFLVFYFLFFLGGDLAFLKAMPPRPMVHGDEKIPGEPQKKEDQGKRLSEITTEQDRRSEDFQQESNSSSSSLLQRSQEVTARDKIKQENENEEIAFSDEDLDEILTQATEVQEYWGTVNTDIITTPTMFEELAAKLEEQEDAWEKKQEQLESFVEEVSQKQESLKKTIKLELVINVCNRTLNILREQETQLLPKKQRSYSDNSTDSDQQMEILSAAMKSQSLSSAVDGVSSQGQSSSLNNVNTVSSELIKKIAFLEQEATSLRKYAQDRGNRAHQEHRQARTAFGQGLLTQAEEYYQDAITSAKKTARAWEKSEQAHSELMQVSGEKLRQWGQRLKKTWIERAEAWEQECSKLFQEVQRKQKIAELQQSIKQAMAKKEAAFEQGNLADQEEKSISGILESESHSGATTQQSSRFSSAIPSGANTGEQLPAENIFESPKKLSISKEPSGSEKLEKAPSSPPYSKNNPISFSVSPEREGNNNRDKDITSPVVDFDFSLQKELSQEDQKKIAKQLRKKAEALTVKAKESYVQALKAYAKKFYEEASSHYAQAISHAEQVVTAWTKTAKAHEPLPGRQWGAQLKDTWIQNVARWKKEQASFFEELKQLQIETPEMKDFFLHEEREIAALSEKLSSLTSEKESEPTKSAERSQKLEVRIIKGTPKSQCPYIREEGTRNPETGDFIVHTRMAADHLLVKLRKGENQEEVKKIEEEFLKSLNYPGVTLKEVPWSAPLYELNFFRPSKLISDANPEEIMKNAMPFILKKVKEEKLAVNCIPDLLLEYMGNSK